MILCRTVLLAQMFMPLTGGEPQESSTVTAAPTSQPAAAAEAKAEAESDDPLHALAETKIGRLTRGSETLTFEEATRIETWYGLVRELIEAGIGFVPRLIVAAIFLVFFWAIYRAMRRMIVGGMNKANVDTSIRDMMGSLIKWGVMGFGLVIAFNQVGVQITALLTGVSIIGLAIGFAAQETLSNFIAGIVIFWDKPFRVNDWVEIDGVYGQVQRITFRSTRLLNGDGTIVIFPNTAMLANKLSNHTTHPMTRVSVPIGIAYKESIERARQVLIATTVGDSRIAQDPPPGVGVSACADSSVNLALGFWVVDESIEKGIRSEYLEKIKNALDAAGIEIPFPHVQLKIDAEAHAIKELTARAA